MKTARILTVLFTIAFVSLLVEPVLGQETYTLRLNFQQGQKFQSTLVKEETIKRSFNNMPITANTCSTMDFICEVIGVEDSNVATIKTTFGDIKFKMDTPHGIVEYDSANPVPDPNAKPNPQLDQMKMMFSALKGASLTMKIDQYGGLKGFEDLNEFYDTMASKIAAGDPNIAAAIKDMFKNLVSEDSINEMNNGMFAAFPKEPVSIGDIWDSTITMGAAQFPIDLDMAYILMDVNDNFATIDINSKMDMGVSQGKLIEIEGMKMNILLTGVMSGRNKIDLKTGWLIEGESKYNFNGTIKIEPSPQMPEGMTMPMNIEGITKVTSQQIK